MLKLVNTDMYTKKKIYTKKYIYNKKYIYPKKKINYFRKSIKVYLIARYFFNIFLSERLIPFFDSKFIPSYISYFKKFSMKFFKKKSPQLRLLIKRMITHDLKYILSIYMKFKRIKIEKLISKKYYFFYSNKVKFNKIRSYKKKFFWKVLSWNERFRLFKFFMEKISLYKFLKKKQTKLKKLNQVNIFDIYLKLRKKLLFRKQKYYILKTTFKINNTYLTLLDNFGRTIFVYSAGRLFASQGNSADFIRERKGLGIPKSQKPKRHKKILKDQNQQENKKPKNKFRTKKRRKARNALKQILRILIKKLINLKIFNIRILEIERNSRRNTMIILKSLYKHGIGVRDCVNLKARPHNNNSGVRFKKMPRK